jgi:predicted nucleotidyltransferase
MKVQDISEKIERLKREIVGKYNPMKIILFGSAAQDETEEVNDIDLLIIKKDVPFLGADRIRELYHLIDADTAVDFLVYTPEEFEGRLALGDPFIKEVVRRGKVLYG